MSFAPVRTLLPPRGLSPLVVDSPHSGRLYPADFHYTCPLSLLRATEDFRVDELVESATDAGATVIMAEFPRSYIDVNRAPNDIDPALLADPWPEPLHPTERTPLGLGLVRRLCMTGVPVYAAPLKAAEILARLDHCYRPYHAALDAALRVRRDQFGFAVLLNCHSMPSRGADDPQAARADFVLGDREGKSCDPAHVAKAAELLQSLGYRVALNKPYKGMEIVRRWGRPESGTHALQIEINRGLYMDERKHEINGGFDVLRRQLKIFFEAFVESLSRAAPQQLAAE